MTLQQRVRMASYLQPARHGQAKGMRRYPNTGALADTCWTVCDGDPIAAIDLALTVYPRIARGELPVPEYRRGPKAWAA